MASVTARFYFVLVIVAVCNFVNLSVAADSIKFTEQQLEHFEKKIRPLLVKRCYQCHSAKAKRLEGGLYLDSRKGALKGGDTAPAIKPGNLKASLLVQAIHYKGDYKMPPKGKLPDNEIQLLEDWVRDGAAWTPSSTNTATDDFNIEKRKASHWAWKPIKVVTPPDIDLSAHPADAAERLKAWNDSDIDKYIAARVLDARLVPNAPAQRNTLIRRVYFDVIGLPPTSNEVEAFVNDSSPQAFERVVDRLLQSAHFGERWARHWLDLVRYAETLGHEFDYPLQHAHQYRDYVIRAFNADVPYDQFVKEHIAGDLMKNPRRHPADQYNESIIGTGFWFLGEDKHSPVDVRAEEASRFDNQIDVFSKTFLGLTVACARCHDHKFDAISTRDYYAISGFLQSSRRQDALLDPHRQIETRARQLQRLYEQANQALGDASRKLPENIEGELSNYLRGAREVLFGKPKPTDSSTKAQTKPDVVFEDFEDGTYDGWKVEGNAFGNAPSAGTVRRQQKVSGFDGKRLVNTFANTDAATGTLTSDPFIINHHSIRFLIGGGGHKNQTCVNLKVGGNVARTAAGKNNERLEPHSWDVRDLIGKQAVIEIVDNHRRGWGHINVDHIVFTDGSVTSYRRPVSVVAKEFEVKEQKLKSVAVALSSKSISKPTHPLYAWFATARSGETSGKAFDAQWSMVANELSRINEQAEQSRQNTTLFEDFSGGTFDKWFVTGHAFGDAPTHAAQWNSSISKPTIAMSGITHSGLLAKNLCGVIRSRTFKIEKPNILYHIAGRKAQVRLIIEGYVMDVHNALLFRGASFKVDHDEFRWQRQAADVGNYVGNTAHIEIIDDGDGWVALDEIRFADPGANPLDRANKEVLDILADSNVPSFSAFAKRLAAKMNAAINAWRNHTASPSQIQLVNWLLETRLVDLKGHRQFADFARQLKSIGDQIPQPMRAMAMTDGTPENEHVFIRGSHKNLGEVVPRRVLEAIGGPNHEPIEDGSGRMKLAQQLVDPSNPFVPRVLVNRIWHHLFGRGIVPSVDNFGVLGERPTHPKLLDYLADRFVKDGWSIKRMMRAILLSQTYRMSSQPNSAAAESDPSNALLHRQRIRRLEGEVIRDAMLSISGRIDRRHFGPSIPIHLTEFMQGRGRPRQSGPLDGAGRRSIYISVRRNFLSPMMLAFDTPSPFSSMGRRTVSNVPAQALILLNDPAVIQQAELWAKTVLTDQSKTAQQRIEDIYQMAFARTPTETEVKSALLFIDTQGKRHGISFEQRRDHPQSWTDLCHVMFNVKEFIFIN